MSSRPLAESLSVALCTYNGARYLEQQLASLARQSRLPDELVVCDDGSIDQTLELLEGFAASAPFPVRIHVNPVNLGSSANFDQAMRLCTGGLIAFCDQDDLWLPARLAAGAAALERDPNLGLVFSDAYLIDDTGARLPGRLWDNFHFDPAIRACIRRGDMLPLVRYRFVTGATVMLRAGLRQYLCPALGEWLHDGWIAALAACMAGIAFLDEPLIEYRVHAQQQVGTGVGPRRKPLPEMARDHWLGPDWHRDAIGQLLTCIRTIPQGLRTAAADDFARQQEFLAMRLTLPSSRWALAPGPLSRRLPTARQRLEEHAARPAAPQTRQRDRIRRRPALLGPAPRRRRKGMMWPARPRKHN